MGNKSYAVTFYYKQLNNKQKPTGFGTTLGLIQLHDEIDADNYIIKTLVPCLEQAYAYIKVINTTKEEITEEEFNRREQEFT